MSPFGESTIITQRLRLVPLQPEDADEMALVLRDERLHEFIGGHPATAVELRERYARLADGSPNPGEVWRNWIIRRRSDSQAVGTVQASVFLHDQKWTAEVAWVVGVVWQNHGLASEAVQGLVAWLRQEGAQEIVARINPKHCSSALVALRAGLRPTDDQENGEQVWRHPKKMAGARTGTSDE